MCNPVQKFVISCNYNLKAQNAEVLMKTMEAWIVRAGMNCHDVTITVSFFTVIFL